MDGLQRWTSMFLTVTAFARWHDIVQCMIAALRQGRNVVLRQFALGVLSTVGAAMIKSRLHLYPLGVRQVVNRRSSLASTPPLGFGAMDFRMGNTARCFLSASFLSMRRIIGYIIRTACVSVIQTPGRYLRATLLSMCCMPGSIDSMPFLEVCRTIRCMIGETLLTMRSIVCTVIGTFLFGGLLWHSVGSRVIRGSQWEQGWRGSETRYPVLQHSAIPKDKHSIFRTITQEVCDAPY